MTDEELKAIEQRTEAQWRNELAYVEAEVARSDALALVAEVRRLRGLLEERDEEARGLAFERDLAD